MNTIELRHRLTEKLGVLSPEHLNSLWQFIESLTDEQQSDKLDNYLVEQSLQKWRYLMQNNEELEPKNPLNENEIKMICQFLSQSHQYRPVGLAKGEFTVPDDFNEPLPNEVLDLFYPQ